MRRLRRVGLASFVGLLLVSPSPASAQALQSFEDLALRINLGDRLQVADQSGGEATGRLTRLTRDEITIETDAGARRFTSGTVRAVAVRGHALRRAGAIGAVVFAGLGAIANCAHERKASCVVIGPIAAAPIGAGVGLAIGALVPQMKSVYRAPEIAAAAAPSRSAIELQASFLEDLGVRVNLNDQLRVDDRSGATTTGRLTWLTPDEMTIRTAIGEKHFTRETVRQVAVRHRPLRTAVLIGAGLGAAAGAAAACTGSDREECADAPLITGGLGAGVGLVLGALIHRTTIVVAYPFR